MPQAGLPLPLVDPGVGPDVDPEAFHPSSSPLAVVLSPVPELQDTLTVLHPFPQITGVSVWFFQAARRYRGKLAPQC